MATRRSPPERIQLRAVEADDLQILFEQQRDPEATRLAAVASREREAFFAHWNRILAGGAIAQRAIVWGGRLAGHVIAFSWNGEPEVGYWLGREFWGRGIASEALAQFLEQVELRPLFAHVAKHNRGSARVLEKCGFVLIRDNPDFATVGGVKVEGFVFELRERGGERNVAR